MATRYRRVLVVDDDERLRRAFSCAASSSLSVFTAATGPTALELAREVRPDLLLLDLRLGVESSLALLRPMKTLIPGLTVVVMCGYLSVATTQLVLKEGATGVVFKPITLPELLRELENDSAATELPMENTPTLARAEWEHIMRVLADSKGNKSEAARRLGIHRQSLQRRLHKLPPRE